MIKISNIEYLYNLKIQKIYLPNSPKQGRTGSGTQLFFEATAIWKNLIANSLFLDLQNNGSTNHKLWSFSEKQAGLPISKGSF